MLAIGCVWLDGVSPYQVEAAAGRVDTIDPPFNFSGSRARVAQW